MTLHRKISQNSVLKVFIVTPIEVLCSNFVKFGGREIGEIVRVAYLTKNKHLPGSSAVTTARIVPKICQGQPPTIYSECSRFHPNRFTFGRVIAERVNAWTPPKSRKLNPIFGRNLAYYPHMPIGKTWIYRLLFVIFCVFVRLRISPPRIKRQILYSGSSASKAQNLTFWETLLPQKPQIGRLL